MKPGQRPLGLPDKTPAVPDSPEVVAIRKDLILALVPVASKYSLSNPQQVVEIASKLCEYVVTGRKPLDSPPEQGGPA